MHHDRSGWHRGRGWRGPRGSYFQRGGIKFAILELLKEKPRHGYDIIREIEERTMGMYSPSPGVIYPTLQALEDQDYVRSSDQDGKKVYAITEAGLAYLERHRAKAREQGRDRCEGPPWTWPYAPPDAGEPAPGGTQGAQDSGAAESAGAAEEGGGPRGGGPGEGGPAAGEPAGEKGAGGGPNWRFGTRTAGGGFGAWFMPGDMPELMKELRWFFGDFAGAIQRTVSDPQKIKEIRQVLREAKHKIDEIVMR